MGQGLERTARVALIVAGPTCSGKSALAMALAARFGGTVINADSMQVYRELRLLTARPTAADERLVPHALYGVRAAAEPGNAAWWRAAALDAMAAARLPILCGGTGLYFAALTQGIAPMPDPGKAARAEARGLLDTEGAAVLHRRLHGADPATAAQLHPSDSQRIARAWEVWRGTGHGLAHWQAKAQAQSQSQSQVQAQGGIPAPYRFRMLLLDPPRPALRAAIAERFDAMLAAGALDEARALFALQLDPALPAMRAHGVPELAAFLRGTFGLQEASRRVVLATGQYTKRQATWFRHRPPVPAGLTHTIHARFAGLEQFLEREWADIESFISGAG